MSDASDIGLIPILLSTEGDDATWQDGFATSPILNTKNENSIALVKGLKQWEKHSSIRKFL
jgi:hypothetical protein